jgi:hypothetical protein
MKKERNILLIGQKLKLWVLQLNIKDSILNWIEKTSGRIHSWAWDKRWKERNSEKWMKEYREWKKTRCPHN